MKNTTINKKIPTSMATSFFLLKLCIGDYSQVVLIMLSSTVRTSTMILAKYNLKNFGFHNDDDNNTTITLTITITTTAQDCRMLKGITIMMIVLLMKVCIESSRDISFVFFPLSAWITTEGLYINNNNNYTYIYIFLRVVSMTEWSCFFYVKMHFT